MKIREKIEIQNQKLERQTTKLQEMDEIKSRFFSNISHEFRTPLTLIIGPLEKLLNTRAEENLKAQYLTILGNAKRLLRLINELLDFSKFESGKMLLQARYGKFNQFLKSVIHSFELLATEKNINLEFTGSQEEIMLSFDFDKLEKVFYNK